MITKEQYGEWKNSPAGRFFFKFLEDRKNDLTSESMEGWLNSTPSFRLEGEVNKGRILELVDILEVLTHETIVNFYEDKSGRENPTDDPR